MGGKGDKGGSVPQIQRPQPKENDNMELYGAMLSAMMANQSSMMQQMQAPQPLAMPEVYETPKIDFTSKIDSLNAKAKADYTSAQAKRKRFANMTHTSYLLDEQEPSTTTTVLK
jgi:hypothetical protein